MPTTNNFGWTLPNLGASRNVWGGILHTLFGAQDSDLASGWIPAGETWVFGSALTAGTQSFTLTMTGDTTAKYTAGTKIKLTQSATVKYFIVTKAVFSAGTTTLTIHGGTDYTLANAAITLPYYTRVNPADFNKNPTKWAVQYLNTGNVAISTPSSNIWYNPTGHQVILGPGVWSVYYTITVILSSGDSIEYILKSTLHTTNNNETIANSNLFVQLIGTAGDLLEIDTTFSKEFYIDITSETTYFLNILASVDGSLSTLIAGGANTTTIIRAVNAYL